MVNFNNNNFEYEYLIFKESTVVHQYPLSEIIMIIIVPFSPLNLVVQSHMHKMNKTTLYLNICN